MEKACLVCGTVFATTNKLRKTCSSSCSKQLEKQRKIEWEKAHPDKVKAAKDKYYSTHKEEIHRYWKRRYPKIKERLRQKRQLPNYREAAKIAFRKNHLKQRYGENALERIRLDHGKCEKCKKLCVDPTTLKRERKFDIHHIDLNPENNDINNLALLCDECHRKVHRFLLREMRIHQRNFIIEKFKEFLLLLPDEPLVTTSS